MRAVCRASLPARPREPRVDEPAPVEAELQGNPRDRATTDGDALEREFELDADHLCSRRIHSIRATTEDSVALG